MATNEHFDETGLIMIPIGLVVLLAMPLLPAVIGITKAILS